MNELRIRCSMVVGGKQLRRPLPVQVGIHGNLDTAHEPDSCHTEELSGNTLLLRVKNPQTSAYM